MSSRGSAPTQRRTNGSLCSATTPHYAIQYEQAPIGRSRVGGQAATIYGVDRGTVRLLRRPPPAPPFAAVKKIPKRCDLLGVTIGGGVRASGNGGSA